MKIVEVKTAKEFANTFFGDPVLKMAVNAVLDNAPGFELVRCEYCKSYDKECGYCEEMCRSRNYNDYCSYGERKDNGND